MYAQIIEFELQGMTHGEYEEFCESAVPAIAAVPGVLGKLFLADAEASRCAGVYTFTDREAADAYLRSDMFQAGIATNPAVTNIRTRGSDVLDRPTRALSEAIAGAVGV